MSNNSSQKDVLFRTNKKKTIPYYSSHNIVNTKTLDSDESQLNVHSFNNAFQQMVDNDLAVQMKIDKASRYQYGAKSYDLSSVVYKQSGYKYFDPYKTDEFQVLRKYKKSIDESINKLEGIDEEVYFVSEISGLIMFGTESGLYQIKDDEVYYVPAIEDGSYAACYGWCYTGSEYLVVRDDGIFGIVFQDSGERKYTHLRTRCNNKILGGRTILYSESDNIVYVGTEGLMYKSYYRGINSYLDFSQVLIFNNGEEITSSDINFIHNVSDDDIIFGSNEGLYKLSSHQTISDGGIIEKEYESTCLDKYNNIVYFGTENGIYTSDRTKSGQQLGITEKVYDLFIKDGYLYVSTYDKITKINIKTETNKVYSVGTFGTPIRICPVEKNGTSYIVWSNEDKIIYFTNEEDSTTYKSSLSGIPFVNGLNNEYLNVHDDNTVSVLYNLYFQRQNEPHLTRSSNSNLDELSIIDGLSVGLSNVFDIGDFENQKYAITYNGIISNDEYIVTFDNVDQFVKTSIPNLRYLTLKNGTVGYICSNFEVSSSEITGVGSVGSINSIPLISRGNTILSTNLCDQQVQLTSTPYTIQSIVEDGEYAWIENGDNLDLLTRYENNHQIYGKYKDYEVLDIKEYYIYNGQSEICSDYEDDSKDETTQLSDTRTAIVSKISDGNNMCVMFDILLSDDETISSCVVYQGNDINNIYINNGIYICGTNGVSVFGVNDTSFEVSGILSASGSISTLLDLSGIDCISYAELCDLTYVASFDKVFVLSSSLSIIPAVTSSDLDIDDEYLETHTEEEIRNLVDNINAQCSSTQSYTSVKKICNILSGYYSNLKTDGINIYAIEDNYKIINLLTEELIVSCDGAIESYYINEDGSIDYSINGTDFEYIYNSNQKYKLCQKSGFTYSLLDKDLINLGVFKKIYPIDNENVHHLWCSQEGVSYSSYDDTSFTLLSSEGYDIGNFGISKIKKFDDTIYALVNYGGVLIKVNEDHQLERFTSLYGIQDFSIVGGILFVLQDGYWKACRYTDTSNLDFISLDSSISINGGVVDSDYNKILLFTSNGYYYSDIYYNYEINYLYKEIDLANSQTDSYETKIELIKNSFGSNFVPAIIRESTYSYVSFIMYKGIEEDGLQVEVIAYDKSDDSDENDTTSISYDNLYTSITRNNRTYFLGRKDGNIYICSTNISQYDGENINQIPFIQYKDERLYSKNIYGYVESNGINYFITDNGVYTSNGESEIEDIFNKISLGSSIDNLSCFSIDNKSDGKYLVSTNNGIYLLTSNGILKSGKIYSSKYGNVRDVLKYESENGILYYCSDGDNILSSSNSSTWKHVIKIDNNIINDIFKDEYGDVYIATDKGLYYTNSQYELKEDIDRLNGSRIKQIINIMQDEISSYVYSILDQHKKDYHKYDDERKDLIPSLCAECMTNEFDGFVESYYGNSVSSYQSYDTSCDFVRYIKYGNSRTSDISVSYSNFTTSNSVKTIRCPYILKRFLTGINELYIFVPTTETYYVNQIPGINGCDYSYGFDKRSNMYNVLPSEMNSENLTPNNSYTSFSIGIPEDFTFIEQMIDIQANGNSLPLKIYINDNDLNDNDGTRMFNSVVCKTVCMSRPERINTYNLGDYEIKFACFGTDAQAIKLTFIEKDMSNCCVLRFNANGGTGVMAKQFVNFDEETKLIKNTFTLDGSSTQFTGWEAESNDRNHIGGIFANIMQDEEEIKINSGIVKPGQIIDLYAIWSSEDNNNTTLFIGDIGKKEVNIAHGALDKDETHVVVNYGVK